MASSIVGAASSGHAEPSAPWPLGSLSIVSGLIRDCPAGFGCSKFRVTACPNVQADIFGELAETDPTGPARGVVVFYDGGGGAKWWSESPEGDAFLAKLRDQDGFVVMQVRWLTAWLDSNPGEQTGPAHLACRPATVSRWIHDTLYAPLGLSSAPGQCGFCITGNSGGSSQVGYQLSHYGLDSILDAAVPTGGPDHAAITKACLMVPGYEFNDVHRETIDNSYGYLDPTTNPGPCELMEPSWSSTWDADGIDLGGNDYAHPSTRVEFVEGGLDDTGAPAHAADYRDRLLQEPSNHVTWTYVADMPHHIEDKPEGEAAIEAAFLKAIGPVTAIASGPADPTNDTSATFDFSADQTGTTFACSVDGGAAQSCSTPATYSGLALGPHSFSVVGTNAAQEAGPPATWLWVVANGPITTITSGPPDPANSSSATFAWSSNDPTATFTCSVDGGDGQPCSSPVAYAGLADGSHDFSVVGTSGTGTQGPAGTWAWTVDMATPALVSTKMLDDNADGRIDTVLATFSEPLAAYTAGTAPWTLSGVPSGGTLKVVSVNGSTATLTLTEGAGAPDTSVDAFSVALAANQAGIRDRAGNLAQFGATAPADSAGPVPVSVSDTNGSLDGGIQKGDTLKVNFSEGLSPGSVPATSKIQEADPAAPGLDVVSLSGISAGALALNSDGYVTADGGTVRFGSSPVALSDGNRTLTVTVGGTCSRACSARSAGGPATFTFVPAATLKDAVANRAAGSFTVQGFRLF